MNYSRNLNKRKMGQRVVGLIVVAVLIGASVGFMVAYGFMQIQHSEDEKQKEVQIFGAYDTREFTKEISLDWQSDENFKALEITLDEDVQQFTYYLSKGYNIDYPLALAVIQVESDFQADLISDTEDYGLMQINKNNHDWITQTIGVEDYLDPVQNIRAGMFILRKLFEKYQKPSLVLMAYNMGETGAARLWKQGIYSTDHTEKVLQYQKQFNDKLEGD